MVPTAGGLSRQNISQLIYQHFGWYFIASIRLLARKRLTRVLPTNLPNFEEPCPIFILTKATEITRGLTIDLSTPPPRIMLQTGFAFFNVESVHGFTSTFVAIFYTTSHPFEFSSISKWTALDILKFLVTILRNQDKKFALIQVDEDGSLARSSEIIRICHDMNMIVQTTGGYAFSINGKREIPNNTLYNITGSFLLNSIHKKKLW